MVGLLHAMAFMVLLLIGWVIWNNKPLPFRAVKLVCVVPNNQAWKNPGCFSKRGNNFKIVLLSEGHKLFWWEIIFKAEKNQVCFVQQCDENGCLIRVFFVERMINSDLLILIAPLTNSQPGKLEGRCFDNKVPTNRNYIHAYHKYVKSLNRLTWKHDNFDNLIALREQYANWSMVCKLWFKIFFSKFRFNIWTSFRH